MISTPGVKCSAAAANKFYCSPSFSCIIFNFVILCWVVLTARPLFAGRGSNNESCYPLFLYSIKYEQGVRPKYAIFLIPRGADIDPPPSSPWLGQNRSEHNLIVARKQLVHPETRHFPFRAKLQHAHENTLPYTHQHISCHHRKTNYSKKTSSQRSLQTPRPHGDHGPHPNQQLTYNQPLTTLFLRLMRLTNPTKHTPNIGPSEGASLSFCYCSR